MRSAKASFSLAMVASVCLVLQGCSVAATPTDPSMVRSTSALVAPVGTVQQIKAEIGDAACTDTAQCRSLPLGAKACGGPETYLAWSTTKSTASSLQALATRYAGERRAQIAANHEISTCSMMLAPAAICGPAGHCVLQGAGAGSAADPR